MLARRIIARMMEANNSGGDIARTLLDSSPFYAQLTKTLVLQRGTGSPTFTRATTGTVSDNEGVLRTCLAGEARFTGARRVDNLIRLGAAQSSTLAIAASVTMTLPAGTYIFSQGVSGGTATFSGTGGATGTLDASASVRTSVVKTISAGTLIVTGSVAILTDIQVENITGRTDQTTPSEYVSVGVLSAPYHGAGVDGVKFFDTDRDGVPLSPVPAYLAEGARTNLCLQSQTFNNASWVKSAIGGASVPVVTADAGVAPDGTTTADKVVFVAPVSGDVSAIKQSPSTAAGTYTGSFYVKAFDSGDVGKIIGFRHVAGGPYGLVTLTADWQRIPTTEVRAVNNFEIVLRPSEGTSSGTVSCYLWGAQVELGSFATSYIPTTTTAVARNTDVESVPTSGNITAAAGWVSLEYTPQHAPSGTVFLWGTYVDASNYTAILHDATNLIFRKRIAGSNYDATIANAFVSGITYKMAATWGAGGTAIALDGVAGTPHANTTAAQVGAAMQWGADGNSLQQPFFAIGNGRIGQRAISSSELQAITS